MGHHPIEEANEKSIFGELTSQEFYQKHNILHQESFFLNHQNMSIFTQSWRPATTTAPLSGLVAMIHGYFSESSWLFQLTAVAIAKQGFIAVSLDLRGHGRSDGPRTHLPSSIDPVVSDCIQVFDSARAAHPSLPAFLYGESLGGAIAILISLTPNQQWAGLILNGAMCGLSGQLKPIWPLEEFLPIMAFLLPKCRALFTKSLVDKSYKQTWKRRLARNSPTGHGTTERATFATAWMMTRLVREIERRCGEMVVPFLMVHGTHDSVCDSESAELVFELAGSKDKTLKIVEGMWHQMVGEPEDVVERGFGLIFGWLRERASSWRVVV